MGFLSSTKFKTTVISVGNLAVGGVGKTPHIAYLIELLHSTYNIATLSRGYKRQTKGFYLATVNSTAEEIGDEPLQYAKRYKDILVAVDEKRVNGINQLNKLNHELQVVLLDDAFQHRAVQPHINILITEYGNLYVNDCLLPSGRLREYESASKRADIIVVSKCPPVLSPIDRRRVIEELNIKHNQDLFFSYIIYKDIVPHTEIAKNQPLDIDVASVLLITGIANPSPLYYKLKNNCKTIEHISFNDHHNFTLNDIEMIKGKFNALIGNNKLIITTEKDLMRLSLPKIKTEIETLPVYYIPIDIDFHGEDKNKFDSKILNYVKENTRN
jgi:tetraacyldisaccharide 4'-kinase